MQEKHWKTIAVALALLVVIEFSIILNQVTSNPRPTLLRETECSATICKDVSASSFYYDSYTQMCYCYKGSELLKQQYIR